MFKSQATKFNKESRVEQTDFGLYIIGKFNDFAHNIKYHLDSDEKSRHSVTVSTHQMKVEHKCLYIYIAVKYNSAHL